MSRHGYLHRRDKVVQAPAILQLSMFMRMVSQEGIPCLVHCSDGWDRTAAGARTASRSLHRTIKGFATLIEKDWRLLATNFESDPDMQTAITAMISDLHFVQFLDCVADMAAIPLLV